jgi:putative transposase
VGKQLIVIEFLQAENRLLKDRLGGRRIQFSDAERALLARKAKAVGRKALLELDTIVSPDTLLRWHRRLVAQKWTFIERRGVGRPGIMRHLSELIVRMAHENRGWGYTRIQGALANLNHKVGRGTIANVLKRNGIEPAPERSRRTPWSTFLKAHWKILAASACCPKTQLNAAASRDLAVTVDVVKISSQHSSQWLPPQVFCNSC